ncbi:MAG: lipopolysaccharide transport periplasmic protein LptA [Proteobacteria bacterium]|nr:lipopolysaccharide transport periplasmic protein LptA [Pseudomonadota bacterium]MBU1737518.1 lipopolysaccharide transport periplasmic protein LptA [Pseudomonadota bacterium]
MGLVNKKICIPVLLTACFLAVQNVRAVTAGDKGSSGPIHIEADRMESEQNKSTVRFFGNVEARQVDLVIRSDEMTVQYKKDEAGDEAPVAAAATKSIEKLLATGHVEIIREGWAATGDKVDYFSSERKVVLTGNTRVWQDNNMVTGERITLYLDEGKSIVENKGDTEGGRVKAFFYPDSGPGK